MSKLVKGVKKVVKGVGKAVGSILSGVTKVFKSAWDSTIGKVVISAAAIYLGGWALGAWGGPGTLFGGTSASAAGSAASSLTATGLEAAPLAPGAGVLAPTAAAGLPAVAAATSSLVPEAAALTATGLETAAPLAAGAGVMAPGASVAAATPSLTGAAKVFADIKSLLVGQPGAAKTGGLVGLLSEHPVLGLAGMQGIAAMTQKTPDEVQYEIEKNRAAVANQSWAVRPIPLPIAQKGPLVRMDGTPVYGPNGTLTDSQVV